MNRKIGFSLFGSVFAFLVATSCCWLPWLAALVGMTMGSTVLFRKAEAFSGWFMGLGLVLLGYAGWRFFLKKGQRANTRHPELQSMITCPQCGFQKTETMPTDACQFFYECENCHAVLRPKPGDCCVYCSYGTVKCPSMQSGAGCCRIPQ